jgi:two-component system, NtrC family, sensor kinase
MNKRALLRQLGLLDDQIPPLTRDDAGQDPGRGPPSAEETETRRLEEQLLHTDRLASLGTIAASVGHEIKNPISYVLLNVQHALDALERPGRAELLQEAEVDVASIRESLRIAIDGAERIASLVTKLQRLARPDWDEARSADLRQVIDSVLALAGPELESYAQVTLEYGEIPAVRGNAVRLSQVVLDLLINAGHALADYKGDDALIQIRTARAPNGNVALEIADNGPGIPEAMRERIFEPYVTSRPDEGGSGLGLYVCRQIVTALGGTIAAVGPEEGGAVIRVELPPATSE